MKRAACTKDATTCVCSGACRCATSKHSIVQFPTSQSFHNMSTNTPTNSMAKMNGDLVSLLKSKPSGSKVSLQGGSKTVGRTKQYTCKSHDVTYTNYYSYFNHYTQSHKLYPFSEFCVNFSDLICEFCPHILNFSAVTKKYVHFKEKHSLYLYYYCNVCQKPYKNLSTTHASRKHSGQPWVKNVLNKFKDMIDTIDIDHCLTPVTGGTVIYEPIKTAKKNERVCLGCRKKFTDVNAFRAHINKCLFKNENNVRGGKENSQGSSNVASTSAGQTELQSQVSDILNFGKKLELDDKKKTMIWIVLCQKQGKKLDLS